MKKITVSPVKIMTIFFLATIILISCQKQTDKLFTTTQKDSLIISTLGFKSLAATTISSTLFDLTKIPITPAASININGQSGLTYQNLYFTNPSGDEIYLTNCSNIIINNCYFGKSSGMAIHLEHCSNITIQNSFFSNNLFSVYANYGTGIQVLSNQFVNTSRKYVQFDNCYGGGNKILNNVGECFPGESSSEDLINMYKSNGLSSDPISIQNNVFRGGGPSTSGSGIMVGDGGGSYITVQNNTLIDPGQVGIGVASGTNIVVSSNKIYAKSQSFTNVGLYVWNQYTTSCAIITVSNNQINFTNSVGNQNALWDPKTCGTVTGWSTNVTNAPLSTFTVPSYLFSVSSTAFAVLRYGNAP